MVNHGSIFFDDLLVTFAFSEDVFDISSYLFKPFDGKYSDNPYDISRFDKTGSLFYYLPRSIFSSKKRKKEEIDIFIDKCK